MNGYEKNNFTENTPDWILYCFYDFDTRSFDPEYLQTAKLSFFRPDGNSDGDFCNSFCQHRIFVETIFSLHFIIDEGFSSGCGDILDFALSDFGHSRKCLSCRG